MIFGMNISVSIHNYSKSVLTADLTITAAVFFPIDGE